MRKHQGLLTAPSAAWRAKENAKARHIEAARRALLEEMPFVALHPDFQQLVRERAGY